jgi:hypothetical protein
VHLPIRHENLFSSDFKRHYRAILYFIPCTKSVARYLVSAHAVMQRTIYDTVVSISEFSWKVLLAHGHQ